MNLIRRLSYVFAFVLLCSGLLPLSGCSDVSAESSALSFISDISAKRFEQAYSYLTAHASVHIDKDIFVSLYTRAFDALDVKSCRADGGDITSGQGWFSFSYTMVYDTGLAGELSEPCVMQLFEQNGDWLVEWGPSLLFSGMEWGDYVAKTTLSPQRGEIFAADGTPLALNVMAETVYVSLSKIKDEAALVKGLSSILELDESVVSQALKQPKAKRDGFAIIQPSYMPGELSVETKSALLAIPGVGIDSAAYRKARLYPEGEMLAHTLGYVRLISKEELAAHEGQGYNADSYIGKTGLEAAFEDDLRGTSGLEAAVYDDLGVKKRTLYIQDKIDGLDLYLTVDPVLQQRAEMALSTELGTGKSGAIIAMNADTGEIRAIASYPTYDNGLFSLSVPEAAWKQLNDEKSGRPLFNRALSGLYPPGSVIKPFVAAKALADGVLTPNTEFTGTIKDNRWIPEGYNWTFPPIKRKLDSGKPLKLETALLHSDNIFFAFTALSMGKESMDELANSLGLGSPFPFDLPVTTSNYVNEGTDYTIKLLADYGYGQGEMLITPLQLAAYCCAFATGDVPRPMIVASEYATKGTGYELAHEFKPEKLKEGLIGSSQLDYLIPILRKIIDEGTGSPVRIPGKDIIGKTGTAEIGQDKSREIGWFTGISTSEKLLVLVMVDVPAGQSHVKLEMAKYLFSLEQ
ncbi:MAG: penicillin-binding transpeptidase domain-containing protein [Bacillota bacterium]|nr:penicillin-binding transpeptidase domain-containing protein [Bacillota bacterium]